LENDYAAATEAASQPDPVREQRLKFLESKKEEVQARLNDVNKNSCRVEEAIYSQLQNALTQLQEVTQKKMSILLGGEAEIQRQIQQIQWMEEFKEIAKDTLDPAAFVNVWDCHQAMRSSLFSQPSMPPLDVQPDMELIGSVTVRCATGDTASAPKVSTMHSAQPGVPQPPAVPVTQAMVTPVHAPAPQGGPTPHVSLQGVQDDIQQMWADVLAQKETPMQQPPSASSLTDVMKDLEDTLARTGVSGRAQRADKFASKL